MAYVQQEPRRAHAHRVTIWDRLEYRLIVSIVFTFSLFAALTKRIIGVFVPSMANNSGRSIFTEARSVAHTAAGYAFKR